MKMVNKKFRSRPLANNDPVTPTPKVLPDKLILPRTSAQNVRTPSQKLSSSGEVVGNGDASVQATVSKENVATITDSAPVSEPSSMLKETDIHTCNAELGSNASTPVPVSSTSTI